MNQRQRDLSKTNFQCWNWKVALTGIWSGRCSLDHCSKRRGEVSSAQTGALTSLSPLSFSRLPTLTRQHPLRWWRPDTMSSWIVSEQPIFFHVISLIIKGSVCLSVSHIKSSFVLWLKYLYGNGIGSESSQKVIAMLWFSFTKKYISIVKYCNQLLIPWNANCCLFTHF